jgi:hypothetical protein
MFNNGANCLCLIHNDTPRNAGRVLLTSAVRSEGVQLRGNWRRQRPCVGPCQVHCWWEQPSNVRLFVVGRAAQGGGYWGHTVLGDVSRVTWMKSVVWSRLVSEHFYQISSLMTVTSSPPSSLLLKVSAVLSVSYYKTISAWCWRLILTYALFLICDTGDFLVVFISLEHPSLVKVTALLKKVESFKQRCLKG